MWYLTSLMAEQTEPSYYHYKLKKQNVIQIQCLVDKTELCLGAVYLGLKLTETLNLNGYYCIKSENLVKLIVTSIITFQ